MVVSTNRGTHKQVATRSYQKKQEDVHPEEGKRRAHYTDRSPGTEMPSKAPKGLCQRHTGTDELGDCLGNQDC